MDPSYQESLLEKQTETGIPVLENVRRHEEYLTRTIASFAKDQAKFKQASRRKPHHKKVRSSVILPILRLADSHFFVYKVDAIFKPKNMAVEELRETLVHLFFSKIPSICENCGA